MRSYRKLSRPSRLGVLMLLASLMLEMRGSFAKLPATQVDEPTLEVYFSPSCSPCLRELPILAEFLAMPEARLRIVMVDQTQTGRAKVRSIAPSLLPQILIAPSAAPRELLQAAGDAELLLPYARVRGADGRTCSRWRGELSLGRILTLIAACKPIN